MLRYICAQDNSKKFLMYFDETYDRADKFCPSLQIG